MNLIKHKETISTILNSYLKMKCNLTLWQNIFEQRYEKIARIYRFDIDSEKLWLASTHSFSNFKEGYEIYGHFQERKLIFKTNINYIGENKIVVNTPKEIKMLKSRSSERSSVVEKNIYIYYKFLTDSHFNHRARVLDMSQKGLGLIVNNHDSNRFYVGDTISLKNQHGLSQKASVIHKTMGQNTSSMMRFHIGLELL